jgi:radical SAM protein with 4Fe4S-binding SPASM domain
MFMDSNLKVISWNITKQCNLHCRHCYLPAAHAGKDITDRDSLQDLSTPEARNVIDQIALVNPEVMLILSGGEPLLREDIFELAEYASVKGMMVVLGSNGLLINNSIARTLRQKGVSGISISLDSCSPAVHDNIRSLEGAWDRATEAVRICKNNGLSVQVNTVITQENYDEMSRLLHHAHALGAKVFSPFFLVCTGRGEEITDITPEQYENILSFIVKEQGTYHGMIVRTRCAPTYRRILYQDKPQSPLLKMDSGRCMAGIHYCRITPAGDVTPCPYMPLTVGNVGVHGFKEIWENSKEFSSLRRPFLKGRCKQCEFQIICGGCRARAFAAYEDYMEEDPWCVYTPKGRDIIEQPVFEEDSLKSGTVTGCVPRWTEEAERRLKSVPFFVRSMVRRAVEKYAIDNMCEEITPRLMEEVRSKVTMGNGARH